MANSSVRISSCAVDGLLTREAASCDDESRLAATLRTTLGVSDDQAPVRRPSPPSLIVRKGVDSQLSLVADEMSRTIEVQLAGRVRDLSVAVENGQFILRGVSRSYYVKQIAQHLAMTAMDARLLGRLVNDIEVCTTR